MINSFQNIISNFIFSLTLIIVFSFFSFAQNINIDKKQLLNKKEAEEKWETVIKAKGGHEKLRSIQNIQMSTIGAYHSGLKKFQHRNEFLIVYPNKYWEWDDLRPTALGLTMSMYNLEIGKNYIVNQGQKTCELTSIEQNDPIKRRFTALVWLFLENEWYRPVPEKIISSKFGAKKAYIIQTNLEGRRIDFVIDKKTNLPIKVSIYFSKEESATERLLIEVRLSDYVKQDGIMVPQKVSGERQTYQFNVKYNENIFTTACLSPESSEGAWKTESK